MRRSDKKRSKHDNIPDNEFRLFNNQATSSTTTTNNPFDNDSLMSSRQFYNQTAMNYPEPSAPPPESDNNPVSSEYTPLLENFTERFINRSQGPVLGVGVIDTTTTSSSSAMTTTTTNSNLAPQQSISTVISPVVPPELLLIHYQQSPFNPNLVESDISSFSSFDGDNNNVQNEHNQRGQQIPSSPIIEWTNGCFTKFRIYFCQTFWYLSQTILIISLIAFNFGSTFVPSIYSSLVITSNFSGHTNTSHTNRLVVFDFFALTTIQLSMAILSLIGSLILLYSASRVIHRLRRRVHLRNLKQITRTATNNLVQSLSSATAMATTNEKISDSELTTTIMTTEMIVFETLGSTMARTFSFIMLLHQFCLCSIYVHLIYDYFDMLISSSVSILSSEWIDYLDINGERKWYLNHLVVGSIWLTLIVVIVVALATTSFVWSRRRRDWRTIQYTRLFLLWIIKISGIIIGFIFIIIITFVGIHLYLKQNLQINNEILLNKINITNQSSIGYVPNPVPVFDTFLNDWYISLFGAIPLLLMPFHLNEILIMLMYSRYDYHYYRRRLQISDNDDNDGIYGQNNANGDNYNDGDQQQRRRLITAQQQMMNYQTIHRYPDILSGIRSPPLPSQPPAPITNEESCDPLLYLASIQSMNRSVISSFFFRSFSTIRNWFIIIIFFIFLFQIIMNIFYFHSIDTNIMINSTRIELNFIRSYLNEKSPYVMAISIVLLLNATISYLLMLFRGKLSQDWLLYGQQQQQQQQSIREKRFHFWTPYIIWNCLALIISLALEYSQKFLQIQIWLIGSTTIVHLLFFPSMLLIYFAAKTIRSSSSSSLPLSTNSNNNGNSNSNRQESIMQRFRPLRWPWIFLFISLFLLATTITYLIFWIYGYWYDESDFGYFNRIRHYDDL